MCPVLQLFHQPQHRGLGQFLPLYSAALLPASPLPGFPKTQKEIGTFPISHGLEINQRLSAVPGRALQSLHQTRECTLALTAAEKGQRLTAKVINPRDERWNEQSSTNRPWN